MQDPTVKVVHIVDAQGAAVIGLPSRESLKIVTLHCSTTTDPDQGTTTKLVPITSVQDLMCTYPDQFNRIESLPGEAKLVVDPNIPIHIDPLQKTSIALKDSIKQELDEMEESGVIRRVTEPTDWVSSLAYSHKKGGDLRVYLDPRHLNKALKRPHHRTLTVELTHKFSKAKVFSKLDAKSGYWIEQLHPESADHLPVPLWKILLPAAAVRPLSVPGHFPTRDGPDFGAGWWDSHNDLLQNLVHLLQNLVHIAVYTNDKKEHDEVLHNLLSVAKESGLVFNSDKCSIKMDLITR